MKITKTTRIADEDAYGVKVFFVIKNMFLKFDRELETHQKVAIMFLTNGLGPCASTGIHGGGTYGYGELDDNGFWQFQLPGKVIYELWGHYD